MPELVIQGSDDRERHIACAAAERWRDAVGECIAVEALEKIVIGVEEEIAGLGVAEVTAFAGPVEGGLFGCASFVGGSSCYGC